MMAINPRNILSLLLSSFDNPEYDVVSIITGQKRTFASQLKNVIREAIKANVFVETYNTLTFASENEFPEPSVIQKKFENVYY